MAFQMFINLHLPQTHPSTSLLEASFSQNAIATRCLIWISNFASVTQNFTSRMDNFRSGIKNFNKRLWITQNFGSGINNFRRRVSAWRQSSLCCATRASVWVQVVSSNYCTYLFTPNWYAFSSRKRSPSSGSIGPSDSISQQFNLTTICCATRASVWVQVVSFNYCTYLFTPNWYAFSSRKRSPSSGSIGSSDSISQQPSRSTTPIETRSLPAQSLGSRTSVRPASLPFAVLWCKEDCSKDANEAGHTLPRWIYSPN